MGQQIIKQPNGLFAIFSSVTDSIILYDGTADEIEAYFVEQAAEQASRDVRNSIDRAETFGSSAYRPFNMSWEKALQTDYETTGEHLEIGETS